jgi:hypothetical protein
MNAPVPPLNVPVTGPLDPSARTINAGDQQFRGAPNLDRFMQRAMAKDPRQRFSSSREQSDAFARAAVADGLWAPPPHPRPLFPPLPMPTLQLRSPQDDLLRRFDVREGPIVLGRHEACQVQVTSRRLSRLHACVYSHRGQLWLADLHSQNGTVYQGRSLTPGIPAPLPTDGSEVSIRLYDREILISTIPSPGQ